MSAVHHLSIDIETYSDIEIGKAGLYKYAQSPAFAILLFAYSLDGQPPVVLDLTEQNELPDDVRELLFAPYTQKHAYNAAFEWYCLSRYFRLDENPDYPPEAWLPQWRCTMLHGLYCGYPAGLEAAGEALGLSQDKQKLSAGKALIRYFCKPAKPTKTNGGRTRNLPQHDPEKWELFKTYNGRDVVTEMEIGRRLSAFPVPDEVQEQWITDLTINARGVAVDCALVSGAQAIDAEAKEKFKQEAATITGLGNPNSPAQLLRWLQEQGVEAENLQKQTVSDLLDGALPSKARRVLEIRRELGKTSTKKYDALESAVCSDSRVRGLLQFYGANRTGRWAGRIVQPQNLPRTYIGDDLLPSARALVKQKNAAGLQAIFGGAADTLSQLIRTAFVAGEGRILVDADFSAIEARVIAWLAGEQWTLDVFRTHGKIYEATASQMFGIPIEKIKKGQPEYSYRQKGKVATLALGYQGGTGSLVSMGALRMGLQADELPDIVHRWRKTNRNVVNFWYTLDAAAKEVVTNGSRVVLQNGRIVLAREMDRANGLDFMTVQLPSGRKLYYPSPHTGKNRFGSPCVCYYGLSQTTKKWQALETYGGKLAENITQATARDCLAEAITRLEAAGYEVVFHVHDEVVIDAPEDEADLADVVRIMSVPPVWAPDLPLNADGWVNPFFKKD